MKRFDCTKPNYNYIFRACALMTKFLHKNKMDFTQEVMGDQVDLELEHGRDEDR